MLLIASLAVFAAAPGLAAQLEPYEARYQAKSRGFSLIVERRLKKLSNGAWQLHMEGARWFGEYRERSRFALLPPPHGLLPLEYSLHLRSIIGKGHDESKVFPLPQISDGRLPEIVLDPLSYQELLRLHLLTGGPDRVTGALYQVMHSDELRKYRFDFLAEETIETPMGKLRVLRFASPQRRSGQPPVEVWFAKDWAYLIVRLQQAGHGSVELLSAKINGRTLTGLEDSASE